MVIRAFDAPSWVLRDEAGRPPLFDLDFANNRYYGVAPLWMGSCSTNNGRSPGIGTWVNSGNDANLFYTKDPDGTWKRPTGTAGQLYYFRRTGYGLWSEGWGADSNWVLQSRDLTNTAVGPDSAGWAKTSCTAALTSVGADGVASKGTRVTATGANATIIQKVSVGVGGRVGATATIAVAGTGYAANDTSAGVTGTGTKAVIKVLTVSGGVPQTISVNSVGLYSVFPTDPDATTNVIGTGVGLTVNWFEDTFTPSFCIKRVTGSGEIDITMDNGATWTNITSSLNTSTYTQVTAAGQTGLGTYYLGIRIVTSGDAIDVDMAQLENNPVCTSPMVTTSAAIKRGVEGYYFNTTGTGYNAGQLFRDKIFHDAPSSVLAQYSGNFDPNLTHNIIGDDLAAFLVSGPAGGGQVGFSCGATDGTGESTITSSNSENSGRYTLNKVLVTADGTGSSIALNGVLTTASSPVMSKSTFSNPITAITKANPGVITSTAHQLGVGDPVNIYGVAGMTEINANNYTVNTTPNANTFTVSSAGTPLNTTAFSTYTSGGIASYTGSVFKGGGTTHGQVLNNGSGILPAHGYMKRVTGWNTRVSNGQKILYSTVVEPY